MGSFDILPAADGLVGGLDLHQCRLMLVAELHAAVRTVISVGEVVRTTKLHVRLWEATCDGVSQPSP